MASILTDKPNFEVRVIRRRGKLEILEVTEWSRMKRGQQDGKILRGKALRDFLYELFAISDREENVRDERMQPRTLTPMQPRILTRGRQ